MDTKIPWKKEIFEIGKLFDCVIVLFKNQKMRLLHFFLTHYFYLNLYNVSSYMLQLMFFKTYPYFLKNLVAEIFTILQTVKFLEKDFCKLFPFVTCEGHDLTLSVH